jgi:hypothetical protein
VVGFQESPAELEVGDTRPMRRGLVIALALEAVTASCDAGPGPAANACVAMCRKWNSCRTSPGLELAPCDGLCRYGGNFMPGLAPSPVCPAVDEQRTCIDAAVTLSCDAYLAAINACPACGVLNGSACTTDADCQMYRADYRCDLSRPGGYCTRACADADDCSVAGPETCSAGVAPPSFDPQASATQGWCLLTCRSDAGCRTTEGYRCVGIVDTFGLCEGP